MAARHTCESYRPRQVPTHRGGFSVAVKYGRMRLRNPGRGEGQPTPERKHR